MYKAWIIYQAGAVSLLEIGVYKFLKGSLCYKPGSKTLQDNQNVPGKLA